MANVAGILAQVQQALGADQPVLENEGLIVGNGDAPVRRIATCFSPSVSILRRAAEAGCDMVLADGHPYYIYDASRVQRTRLSDVMDTPVALAKRQLIDSFGMAIARFPSAYAAARPHGAAMALAKAWGFADSAAPHADADFVVADIPQEPFEPLARRLSRETGCRGIRLIGAADLPVKRVAIATGMLSPMAMGRMLADPSVDVVIGGEVVEWEGGPYFEDVIASGRNAGLILTGFAMSREPMAHALGEVLREVVPGVEVIELGDSDPVWTVPAGEAA